MLLIFTILFVAVLGLTLAFLVYLFTLPSTFPKGIPTIPFYYTLLPLIKNNDQVNLYRQYLKELLTTSGVVKLFFSGRWNILVRKPAYIAEVLKNEDIFAKSGNQVKIPHGALAEYTGDNIINGHGENWKLYTSIFKPALQQDYDCKRIWENDNLLVALIEEQQETGAAVNVNPLLQRYALANLLEVLLGSSFGTLQDPNAPLHAFQMRIKPKIFDPIFLNFPFLDHLKLPTRQETRRLVKVFADELVRTVQNGHSDCHEKGQFENLGCHLLNAFETGILTEKQLRHDMISAFLAGHEKPQLLLISTLFFLAEHGICCKPCLFNKPILLGGKIPTPAGTYVGYNAYSTNRDVDFWGQTADEFNPER
ncbi:cytochrome P450 [Aspergillus pseudoustus]|uniref:Cytochrome P450 n=1 Tax=Aspergillus pseudoustus TaxID=1810923 RepID=A0ABR4KIC3_9EURO